MLTVRKARPQEAGCWIDGARGQYAISELVHRAISRGMTVEDGSKDALKAYEAGEDEAWDPVAEAMVDTSDWIHGLADIAEEWMNEYLAPTGHTFGWHEGEFFLWTDEEWVHAC